MHRPAANIILIISLLFTGLAVAGPIEEATEAFKNEDYTTIRALAEKGNARAQFILGFLSLHLPGPNDVPVDNTEAVKWLRKSAEQGDVFGLDLLGRMYLEGDILPQDNTEGVKWLRKAAEQENADSQDTLGEICYSEKNYPEAAKWWQRAAENGNSDAEYHLGLLYYDGKGVPQDFVLAHMWLHIAAISGRAMAKEDRERVASQMTPAQISEAQRLFREWSQKKYGGVILREYR